MPCGGIADEAVLTIQRLYEIERKGKAMELNGTDLREHALHLLQEFRHWLVGHVGSAQRPRGCWEQQ